MSTSSSTSQAYADACKALNLHARTLQGIERSKGPIKAWASWTFLGGHDPEDAQHQVGDPPTDLTLHPKSPGYRLILNNVLFPAAKKRELKT